MRGNADPIVEYRFCGDARLVDGGRLTVDLDADEKPLLDIQPVKKSDKPKAESATA